MSESESHVFEVQVRVSAHGQPDMVINREYVSKDAASTDKASSEIWDGVSNDVKARMRGVSDGR